jgi:adenylate kinase
MNIILIGPQGSGKGTQAEFIIKEFGLIHIEAGSMIRERAKLHDKKAEIINHLSSQKGMLLPDGIVIDMIYDEIEEHPTEKGYLFDGFPRTVIQYKALKDFCKEKGLIINAALYLNISDKESMIRLTTRRLCDKCGKGYSLLLEPKRTSCDCGEALVKRPDDEPEAISNRLTLFHEQTTPILAMMKDDGILREINGEQTIEQIFTNIKKQIIEVQ